MNKQSVGLEKIRTKMDKIDASLVSLIGERCKLSEKIALIKQKRNIGIRSANREKIALKDRSDWAKKKGIDEQFINRLFKVIFAHSVSIQKRTIASLKCFDRKTKK